MHIRWLIVAVLVVNHGAGHGASGQLHDGVHRQDVNQTHEGAEVEQFDCELSGHGYHGDIGSGCRRYHYCEKTENGTWHQRHAACPPGTTFDDTRAECSSRNVSCRKTNSTANPNPMDPEAVEETTGNATTNFPTPSSPLDATEQSVTSAPEVLVERTNTSVDVKRGHTSHAICPASFGYFPHIESQCRRYYACVRLGEGTVVKHVYDCPRDKRFDSAKMLCVEAAEAPACQFSAATEYKDIAYEEEEMFNMSSLPSRNDYGLVGLLPVNLTVDALDRMMARLIMSYVQSGKNITEGELTAVQKILSETHPVPLTVLATVKLVSSTLHRLPNASELMDMYSIMKDEHKKFFGSGFLNRGRSVVRNLTSLVERYGAIRALSAATSYKRLKNAYESVRSSWFVLRNRTAPFLYNGWDNIAMAEPTTPGPFEAYIDQAPSPQDFINHQQESADLNDQSMAAHNEMHAAIYETSHGYAEGANSPVATLQEPSEHSSRQQSLTASALSSTADRSESGGSEGTEQKDNQQSPLSEISNVVRHTPVKQVVLADTDDEDYDGREPDYSEDMSPHSDPELYLNYDAYDYFDDRGESYILPHFGDHHEDPAMVMHV
ncbi:hypothetical protein HPB50_009012 [Hyalomma asiaticum]|uniref:Uncharacterized protein n=1 Tax=Hyalomma asiaticum TaxID=266040 RepID=A0ACB7S4K1_HYAAI|nr:hypothetical protein HPB50_009012 [Hyalomma asiaticum]